MIKWYKNLRRKKRLFNTNEAFIQIVSELGPNWRSNYIRECQIIKQNITDNNMGEVGRRQKFFTHYNMNPPKTLEQCDRMIEDLRLWRA